MFRRPFHLVPLNEFQSNFQQGTTLDVVKLISFWRAWVHLREAQRELHQISYKQSALLHMPLNIILTSLI
jgi:hypothetical protein